MNTQPWTCQDTVAQMERYRIGQLEPVHAERLFDHALGCDRCYRDHWQPFQEESDFLMGICLDSLEADNSRDDNGGATIDGDSTVLTWAGWTSTADLRFPSSTVDLADSIQKRHERATEAADPSSASSPKGPHLRQVGTLLPRVPKRKLIAGYHLYLGDGPPRPEQTSRTAARVIVEAGGEDDRVYLEALRDGVTVDGIDVQCSERRELRWTHTIEVAGTLMLFQKVDASKRARVGAGILRHGGASWPLAGDSIGIGRGEELELRLPNREVRTNLRFRPDALQAIIDPGEREREAQLTLDAVEVSRRHARLVRTQDGGLELRAESRYPVRVATEDGWHTTEQGQAPLRIRPGDELLIGQALFEYREG